MQDLKPGVKFYMRAKVGGPILIIILVLVGLAVSVYLGYQYWLASVEIPSEEIILGKRAVSEKEAVLEEEKVAEKEEIISEEKVEEKKLEELPSFQIYLSSNRLEQGDTLLVRVEDKTGASKISGEFEAGKIDFSKSAAGDWIALIGIDAKKEPGRYDLTINLPGEEIKKEINVVKRNFPITELAVTKELEEKGYTQPKIAENIAQKDNPSIYQVLEIYTPTPYFNRPFTYPLNRIKIVGAYGNIRKKEEIQLQHLGVDLDAETGTPVYAANDGTVVFTEELINYGKTLIIDHGLGIYSLYLHLNKFDVVKGQKVKQDDVVARTGNTGYSIAPHLHFSIKVNGSSVDPLRFIKTVMDNWGL